MNIPVIHLKGDDADTAFAEHRALLMAARAAPSLNDNASFLSLKMDAYERFHNAFEVAK